MLSVYGIVFCVGGFMTEQDKLLKQIARLVAQMGDDMDFLLGYVHEFGPAAKRRFVARRTVALRANVEKLRLALGTKTQSQKGKAL
jgi:hypothetical protein